jgi:hypothetical protein
MQPRFILCIDEADCDDLQKGKVYRVLADAKAGREGLVRVIDESGEDYLYPEERFVAIEIPPKALEALATSGSVRTRS